MPDYVAKDLIRIGGVAAFSKGAPVPEGHVQEYDLHDQVVEVGTDEAADVVEGFDPDRHDVAEVLAYLEDADGEERVRVLQLEEDGKARKTILEPYAVTYLDEPQQPAEEAGQASPVGDED